METGLLIALVVPLYASQAKLHYDLAGVKRDIAWLRGDYKKRR